MREASRDKKLPAIFCTQLNSEMLAKGGRTLSYVNCYIQDGAHQHADKLSLCKWILLVVQPPDNTLR
jgi:hypothetical protein